MKRQFCACLIILSFASCAVPRQQTVHRVLVIDLSPSMRPYRAQELESVKTALESWQPNEAIDILGIDNNPLGRPPIAHVPPFLYESRRSNPARYAMETSALRKKHLATVLAAVEQAIAAADGTKHSSNAAETCLLDGLEAAARAFRRIPSQSRELVILSDGYEDCRETIHLPRDPLSAERIERLIHRFEQQARLPQFPQPITAHFIGTRLNAASPRGYEDLVEALWTKILTRCGARIRADDFSPTLQQGAKTMYIWRDRMPVLSLNGRNDLVRLVDLFTGTLITGSPGSGKTSTTAKYLHSGLLRMRAGGYAPCAKPTDFRDHMLLITAEGRARDAIEMRPGRDQSEKPTNAINVLDLEQKLFGHGRANVTNVVNLLMRIMSLIERKSGQSAASGDATFWMKYARKIIGAGLTVQSLNSNRFDLKLLLKFVNSLPNTPEQAEDLNLYSIGQLQEAAAKAGPNPPFEFTQVFDFVTREWPLSPPNSRGSGALTVQVLLDVLLSNEVRTLLFEESTFELEQILNHGGILLLDMDVEHYPLTGPVVGMVLKDIISRACKARPELTQMEPDLVQPVYLLVDEAPEFLVESDQAHARTARSSRLVQIFISQTTTSVKAVFQDKDKAGDLLDLAGNRWAHQNGSDETNEFMAKTIGKIIVKRRGDTEGNNLNFGPEFTHGRNYGHNYNEQVDWDCPPRIMSRLLRPSPKNGLKSQAVYWSNGRKFEWNDRRWLPVAMRVNIGAHRRDEACVIAKATMKGGDSRVEKFASKLFDSAAEARWQRLRSFLR